MLAKLACLLTRRSLGRRCANYVNTATAAIKLHMAVDQGVEGEVGPLTNPLARVELIADLADQNVARSNLFATESLHAAALRIRITSVSAGTLTFFMCHDNTLSAKMIQHPHGRGGRIS